MSRRFKVASPRDSSQFKIPSLSISTSKLSIIVSPSKSSGHKLTGTSTDSKVSPEQLIKPTSLYFPGKVGLKLEVVIPVETKPAPVSSSKSQSKLSNKSVLAASKVKLGTQFPNDWMFELKLISGAEGNPE